MHLSARQVIMPSSLTTRFGLWFTKLNIFESGATNVEVIQQERWSTRFFIVLFLTLIVVFAIYGGLDKQAVQVTVYSPSHSTFQSLQQKYPDTLKCACTNIAIALRSFMQIEPIFHQVFFLN